MTAGGALPQLEVISRLVGMPIDSQVAETLERYVDMLTGAGVERGLLGPREADRIWDRHILNCSALAPLLPSGASVADVGSGAGLPGVVLAVLRPDLAVTLIEPLLRRADFLTETVSALALENTTVARTRAEDHRGATFDVVVARAVAPLDRLAGWCWPLVRRGGTLLAMKGRRAAEEVAEHRATLLRRGATAVEIEELGVDVLAEPTTVVRIRKR